MSRVAVKKNGAVVQSGMAKRQSYAIIEITALSIIFFRALNVK